MAYEYDEYEMQDHPSEFDVDRLVAVTTLEDGGKRRITWDSVKTLLKTNGDMGEEEASAMANKIEAELDDVEYTDDVNNKLETYSSSLIRKIYHLFTSIKSIAPSKQTIVILVITALGWVKLSNYVIELNEANILCSQNPNGWFAVTRGCTTMSDVAEKWLMGFKEQLFHLFIIAIGLLKKYAMMGGLVTGFDIKSTITRGAKYGWDLAADGGAWVLTQIGFARDKGPVASGATNELPLPPKADIEAALRGRRRGRRKTRKRGTGKRGTRKRGTRKRGTRKRGTRKRGTGKRHSRKRYYSKKHRVHNKHRKTSKRKE